MKIKVKFPHDYQMAQKLGELFWTETFTPEEMADLDYHVTPSGDSYFTYEDVLFRLEKYKETEKKVVFIAEREDY